MVEGGREGRKDEEMLACPGAKRGRRKERRLERDILRYFKSQNSKGWTEKPKKHYQIMVQELALNDDYLKTSNFPHLPTADQDIQSLVNRN